MFGGKQGAAAPNHAGSSSTQQTSQPQQQRNNRNNQGGKKQNNNQQSNRGGGNANQNNNGSQQSTNNKASKGKKGGANPPSQQNSMQQEDEAIISTSNNIPSQQAAKPQQEKQQVVRGERALEKTSWLSASGPANNFNTLEDLDSGSRGNFDQFAGKKTTYTDDHYSTPLNMNNVSKAQQQRAMQIERDIMSAPTQNRHFAEERNQVAPHCAGEDDTEESKYGATDMRNQTAVSHQDGGVFAKGAKPAKKGGANKKNNGKQNEPKAAKMNAPHGKFKTFKQSIDKNAFAEMNKGFLAEFVQKKASDTFFVPVTVKDSAASSTTNLQSKQKPASVVSTGQVQSEISMNVKKAQPFTPQGGVTQPMRVPAATQAPVFNPSNTNSSMTTQAMPFSSTAAAPSQSSNVFVPSKPATTTQVSAPNPFAKAVTSVKEFTPGAKPFTPSVAPQTTPSATTPAMPVQQQTQQQPTMQQNNVAPAFTPSGQSFQPHKQATFQPAPQQQYQQQHQASSSFTPNQNSHHQMMQQQQQQQQQPYMPHHNNHHQQSNQQQMPYRQHNNNNGYGSGYQNNKQHYYNNNNSAGPSNYYNNNAPGNKPQYGGQNQYQMPHHRQQQQQQQPYNTGGQQNQNMNVNRQHQQPSMPMPMPMPSSNNSQQQTSQVSDTPAGHNPFANLAKQKTFEPQKKQ